VQTPLKPSQFDFDEDSTNDFGMDIQIDLGRGIYPIAAIVYIFIGFYWSLWHPGWLVFVFAWVIEEIIGYMRTGKFHISIYGMFGVAFLVVGFVFGHWRYAWFLFIVAWLIDTVIVRKKPKRKKIKKERI